MLSLGLLLTSTSLNPGNRGWTPPVILPPEAPTISVVRTTTGAEVEWTDGDLHDGVVEARLVYVRQAMGDWALHATFPAETVSPPFQIDGLELATTYYFYGVTVTQGGSSEPSNITNITTFALPGVVQSLVVTIDDSDISATYSAPLDNGGSAVTDYKHELSQDGGDWTPQLEPISSTPGFTRSGLADGVWRLRVAAVTAVGQGSWVTSDPFVIGAASGAPVITYDAETNTFSNLNGDAGQWYADDEAIDGATGATWAGYSEESHAGRAIVQVVAGETSNAIIQQTTGAPYHLETFSYASGQKIIDHGWTGLPASGATTELNKFVTNASGQLQCGSQVLIDGINAIVTQDTENAAHFIEVDAQYTFYNLLCVKDERNYISIFRGNDGQVNVYKTIDGVQSGLIDANSYIRITGAFVAGARVRGEILTNGKFRILVKLAGEDTFKPYSFNPTDQVDATYAVPAELAGATKVGLKGRGFNTQTDNFAWGSLERPININSMTIEETANGRVFRAVGKATSEFTDAVGLVQDALTGELLSHWDYVPGAGAIYTVDIPVPDTAYGREVTVWLTDSAFREYATYRTMDVPLFEPYISPADQRPGINWNFINAWGHSDIANNRFWQSRWVWSNNTAVDLDYCDDNGIPLPNVFSQPGKSGLTLRCIFFEDCPIARGGTWEVIAPGANMSPAYGTGVTGVSNVNGKVTFTVEAGEKIGLSFVAFSAGSLPTDGFASMVIKPVGAGNEAANPQVIADYGREAAGLKMVRVMRASNGEHPIRKRPSDGASVPEFPIGNGANVAAIVEEYDVDTLWPFAVNQSDADVLKIATDWNSVADPSRMFFVQNGNESFWNGSSYADQDRELTEQAVRRGYTPASDPATTIVAVSGVWTDSETGATKQVIPEGTEIVTASNYHRTLVRALRDVPIGEIMLDNATLGSSDANFLYLANWADLWKAGYRAKGVRTIEMASIVASVIGAERVRSLVDFQLGATSAQIFNWLNQMDDDGVPIWQQIDHYSTSGYVTLNLNPGMATRASNPLPWIMDVGTDLESFFVGFFPYVESKVTETLNLLKGYRRDMPGLFKAAYPDADPSTFPTNGLYEHGMHWRLDGFGLDSEGEGLGWDDQTNAALKAGNQDPRWYDQYRALEDGIRSLGLPFAMAFVDYERPSANKAFGRLWMPGQYTDKQPYLALRDALGKPVSS